MSYREELQALYEHYKTSALTAFIRLPEDETDHLAGLPGGFWNFQDFSDSDLRTVADQWRDQSRTLRLIVPNCADLILRDVQALADLREREVGITMQTVKGRLVVQLRAMSRTTPPLRTQRGDIVCEGQSLLETAFGMHGALWRT
jgi:hypothetical protein